MSSPGASAPFSRRRGRALPPPAGGPGPSAALVADETSLAGLLAELAGADRYGFDTEFHREKTYWPMLALLQLSWREGAETRTALVDPLAVGVGPLAAGLLERPATMLAHAAEQDLEILRHECGTVPTALFDTQVAAGFAGHASASLASLVRTYLGHDLPKGDRLTDWSARPLQDSQLRYAAADVVHLGDLEEAIRADLDRRGRLGWAQEECERVRLRTTVEPDPGRAWWKLRDARQLRGTSKGVAQAVAAWREERARRLDVPARYVLADLAILALAHKPPTGRAGLADVRGLDARLARGEAGEEILAAVARGRRLPPESVPGPPGDEVPRELRPAVALAMAWLGQLAREEQIDPGVLATRLDVVELVRDGSGRLRDGWRADLVADPLLRLVSGSASVAFDGAGSLVLEERSHRRLGPETAGPEAGRGPAGSRPATAPAG